jgi:hypothetical protein
MVGISVVQKEDGEMGEVAYGRARLEGRMRDGEDEFETGDRLRKRDRSKEAMNQVTYLLLWHT